MISRRKLAVIGVSVPVSISALLFAGCYVLVRAWTDPRDRLGDVGEYFEHLQLLPALLQVDEVIPFQNHLLQPE